MCLNSAPVSLAYANRGQREGGETETGRDIGRERKREGGEERERGERFLICLLSYTVPLSLAKGQTKRVGKGRGWRQREAQK